MRRRRPGGATGWTLDSHGSVDGSRHAQRGVENLQVHFVLNLRAPAGSWYGYYGNADEVPRDVRVQSDDVAQVGLDHRTLRGGANVLHLKTRF